MKRLALVLLLLLVIGTSVFAQQATPTATPVNPDANITWPPPVYVLRGNFDIRGTAAVRGMSNYFIEFRPLNEDLTIPNENAPWFPATLPQINVVRDDVLGTWNTLTAPDGVYEIRLTVNVTGGQPIFHYVSPIRIENEPPPFAVTVTATPTSAPIATRPPGRATLAPTPTAITGAAQVTALVDANVRVGDSTAYGRVGQLLTGETAPILGISSFGSGWYYIELPDGDRGWIAPSVVRAEGNLLTVPRINPPPLPTPRFTATPIATPIPPTQANLLISGLELNPAVPTCNAAFNVFVNIVNSGSTNTLAGGTVLVTDVHTASGTVGASGTATFPILSPGQNFLLVIPLNVNVFHSEVHTVTAIVDSTNQVAETVENDNTFATSYTLQKGTCP